jgi:hypothetical protein
MNTESLELGRANEANTLETQTLRDQFMLYKPTSDIHYLGDIALQLRNRLFQQAFLIFVQLSKR